MKKMKLLLGLAGSTLALPLAANAADHIDSPAVTAEPTSDISDLFAWTNADADKVNLVMDVAPFLDDMTLSDAVQYVFHVNSSSAYGEAQTMTTIMCEFDSATEAECWVSQGGNVQDYVQGDASATAGLTSDSGKVKVFAGVRDDPFFMEFQGFNATVETVVSVAPDLVFDAANCPTVDTPTSDALLNQLASGPQGVAASDTFAGSNVLSVVVQVDKDLVTAGGSTLGVWASTNVR